MISRGRIFLYQAILLLAVVTLLALAEQAWVRWSFTVLAILVGSWQVLRKTTALINRTTGGVLIIAAFLGMLFEFVWFDAPPVIALSHFMIAVCACKMLQHQNHRDQVQVLVLCLLLVVVAAIVSGDVLFFLVLLLYLTVGVHACVLLQLNLDQHRIRLHNIKAAPDAAHHPGAGTRATPRRSLAWISTAAGMVSLTTGVIVFLFFPRMGVGMFGRLDTGGKTLTGFASSLNFDTLGTVQLSEKSVMVVTMRTEGAAPDQIDMNRLYFRGAVFDRYCHDGGPYDAWQWRNADDFNLAKLALLNARNFGPNEPVPLLKCDPLPDTVPVLYQQYLTQPLDHPYLFSCYPPMEFHSPQARQVIKNLVHQTLRISGKAQGSMRYEVATILRDEHGDLPPQVLEALDRERASTGEPEVLLPSPPLPREAEILAQIRQLDDEAGVSGPLDTAQQRLAFVQTVVRFLQSETFVYRLQNAQPGDREPIGSFLLDYREGYCQHFAAAMAILCQHRGIPARVVSGYRGGDYNTLGQCLVVREKYAHSWVEAYIPGMDWVTFDPTPSAGQDVLRTKPWLMGLYKYLDYVQYQWANLVVAYDAQVRQHLATDFEQWLRRPAGAEETLLGVATAFLRELIWWRANLGFRDRLLYWVFAIMVALLALLIAYVVAVALYKTWVHAWRWWSAHRTQQPAGEVEFYARFCQRMNRLGLQRQPHQTPIEFAHELAARFPALEGAVELVRNYYQVAYGRHGMATTDREAIEGYLARLASIEQLPLDTGTPASKP